MRSIQPVVDVKLNFVAGRRLERLPQEGVAKGVGDRLDVVELGVRATIDLVHFEVEPVDGIARRLGALIPHQRDFLIARNGGQEGRTGRFGKVIIRVIDVLHGPLVA